MSNEIEAALEAGMAALREGDKVKADAAFAQAKVHTGLAEEAEEIEAEEAQARLEREVEGEPEEEGVTRIPESQWLKDGDRDYIADKLDESVFGRQLLEDLMAEDSPLSLVEAGVLAQKGAKLAEQQYPEVAAALAEACRLNPELYPTVFELAVRIGLGLEQGDTPIMSNGNSNSPALRGSAADQLEQLNQQVPPDSPEYKTEKHQKRLAQLYKAAFGDKALVGTRGRTL
jgi:hypothetical protein